MPNEKLIERVSKILGTVSHRTPVHEIRTRITEKGEFVRRRLLGEIESDGLSASALSDEESRVLAARLLAALVPDSLSAISSSLQPTGVSETLAELQFSIFVALSDIPTVVSDTEVLLAVTGMVEAYLAAVEADPVQAAWMAGDLLGDHWPMELALPVLQGAARRAQHPAGREGAIHGLSHALGRAAKGDQWQIMQTLKDISAVDPDRGVREAAEMAMSNLRPR